MRLQRIIFAAAVTVLWACSQEDSGQKIRVGDLCESDTDCGELECNADFSDYIGHLQCTADCAASEECEAQFGANSFCIGAGICVRGCDTDKDCPELTQCNDAGWCERGGPGSGVPTCSGSPTPCILLSSYQCDSALGCYDDSSCGGVTSSCYSQSSSYSCNSLDGCYWSSYDDDCSGSARSCGAYFSSGTCSGQPGCSWRNSCAGTVAFECSDLTVSSCELQPGCSREIQ